MLRTKLNIFCGYRDYGEGQNGNAVCSKLSNHHAAVTDAEQAV